MRHQAALTGTSDGVAVQVPAGLQAHFSLVATQHVAGDSTCSTA